jgi:DNA-binding NarL/FixJ family response regulator
LVREALTRLLEGEADFSLQVPLPALDDLFCRLPDGSHLVAVVGATALRPVDEPRLRYGAKSSKSLRILVLADDYNEETICRLLLLGVAGYLGGEASTDTLKKAIRAVARGEIWAERQLVARAFHQALTADAADDILTSRERQILGLLRAGHPNRRIAELLFLSPDTVKWHLRKVFSKIGAKDRFEAALWARANLVFPKAEAAEPGPQPARTLDRPG